MSRASREERYRIISELGRGGMGVVSCAFDGVRGEEVALKRLAIERFETPHDRERATALFEREYHTLSELAHPNVISVFDYGVDENGPYYTMEHLRGDSLRARTPLPWRDAARFVRDVASALAIVHSRRLVHRDVTPQNIYCDAESGAKLLDFGAMIPMGIAKQVVGTPPFIAPECLESQPLDGQTDLFALGASLYTAVAGRQAFDARSIAQLPAAWQRRPTPLSRLVPGVPEALDALVESLLSLSPASRPRTAAVVYERLTSIADLPRSESLSVVRAYLTRPALVGRERELGYLRRRAERATRGQGTSVVLAGAAGIGRSRLLDSAVLEARLAGFLIARADASDARGPLGAIERILSGLREAGAIGESDLARYGLPLHLTNAADVLFAPERRERTLRDLASVLLELARQRPLAIAVDDLHALDGASLAVFASLAAQAEGRKLWLIMSLVSTAVDRRSPALRLLSTSSRHLKLRPLTPEACRALFSSVFGEATPNLDLFSTLAERRCRGNARHLMECAQAAIDAELARYAGGGWAITSDAHAIAETLDRLTDIEQQIATLSPDAIELLQALSLDRDSVLDLADYPALTEHRDRARMHRALTELSHAGWLVIQTDRARFQRDDQLAHVAACVPPERLRTLHARLATCCAKPELAPLYQTYHWLKAGRFERALVPMNEMSAFVDANPIADAVRSPLSMETLQIFSEMDGVPGAHPGSRANYTAALIINTSYQGFPERGAGLIPRALREITQYTGVSDYAVSGDLPEPERLQRALTLANERCQAPGVGGVDLVRFIRRQTHLCITVGAIANFMADASLLEGLPNLTPFVALSPALGLAQQLIDALSKLARGQTWRAWDAFLAVHDRLSSAQTPAIDGLTLLALRTPTLGYLGAIEAEHAAPSALTHFDEYAPLMGHNAQSLRARYHFASGDLANWALARKQSELLSVQSNSHLETRHTETAVYGGLFALAEDLLGLRRVHTEIVALTATRPGWRYREAIVRCQILRCENRYSAALAIAESSLAGVPVHHSDYVSVAVTQLELLLATGGCEAARSAGEMHLERARAAELPTFRIELALGRACGELHDYDSAERHYDEALRALDAREVRGLHLGRALETGAHIAICRSDARVFEARAKQCAEHYAIERNPTLATRFGQLLRDAARAGLITSGEATSASSDYALRALAMNTDDDAFYAAALDHLVKRSGAFAGFLYVAAREGLRCVARTEAVIWSDTASIDRLAHEYYARFGGNASEDVEVPTELATASASAARSGEFTLWPCALARVAGERRAIEGIVVFVSNATSGAGIASGSLEDLASLMTRRAAATALEADEPTTQ